MSTHPHPPTDTPKRTPPSPVCPLQCRISIQPLAFSSFFTPISFPFCSTFTPSHVQKPSLSSLHATAHSRPLLLSPCFSPSSISLGAQGIVLDRFRIESCGKRSLEERVRQARRGRACTEGVCRHRLLQGKRAGHRRSVGRGGEAGLLPLRLNVGDSTVPAVPALDVPGPKTKAEETGHGVRRKS